MTAPRSYLYVPGDRPEWLNRAMTRGGDEVIVDLEDSVAVEAKDSALETVLSWLSDLAPGQAPVWCRVNSGERRKEEIRRLAASPRLAGFCLPKTETPDELVEVDQWLTAAGSSCLLSPLVESARGVVALSAIAAASRVRLLHLGELDLAADLGLTPGAGGAELLLVRSSVVVASRAARLAAPPAPVSAVIDDLDAFRSSTRQLGRLGFVGRACIHPAQVEVANEVFGQDDRGFTWARGVLAAADRAGRASFRAPDGSMVDEAVLRRARRILGE